MNIDLISGQIALVHITLETAEPYELYGGTTRGAFSFERDGETWHVTAREEAVAGVPLCNYDIYARELSSGREWVILSGKIIVKPRTASVPADKLHPVEYFVTVPVRNEQVDTAGNVIVQGIPGPKGERGEKGEPGEGGMTAEERALLMGAAQREGDNTFTAGNTFTGVVDMSTASVTPPVGWNVGELTPEAIQAVVPMAWNRNTTPPVAAKNASLAIGNEAKAVDDNAVAIGCGAKASGQCVAIGTYAGADPLYTICISGYNGKAAQGSVLISGLAGSTNTKAVGLGYNPEARSYSIALGSETKVLKTAAIAIGAQFTETTDSGNVTHTCTTEGTGSITIGAGANTLNNGTTESSNSVTIGCKALNQGADSVVIGAQAKATAGGTIAIGAGAEATDAGAVVFASHSSDRTMRTQLYFCGAGTPLAVEYYNGEAFMGYTVVDKATGQIAACGTRRMSELFTDNTTAQPATLDEFGDWVMPKVFQPGKGEPQEYQPLPVYPIVEPEIEPLTE